jgi:hypothetical protein
MPKDADTVALEIVQAHTEINTLQPRGSDSLDFHLLSVWTLELMLTEAFTAGRRSGIEDTAQEAARGILKVFG